MGKRVPLIVKNRIEKNIQNSLFSNDIRFSRQKKDHIPMWKNCDVAWKLKAKSKNPNRNSKNWNFEKQIHVFISCPKDHSTQKVGS